MAVNPPLDDDLDAALVEVWTAVSNAGGAVGFVPPVTADRVWVLASPELAKVRSGRDDVVVAFEGDAVVGFGFLVTNVAPVQRHWATVKRLQRLPGPDAAGVGGPLLQALEDRARERGLERVALTVRGGTGIERFYERHGFVVEARLTGRLRLGDDDVREELVMSRSLTDAPTGPVLRVRRLDPDLALPAYAHAGDAGLDLLARVDVTLAPGERAQVPTGIAVAVPEGCVGLVHPRSGLAARHGLGLVNAPGTIDAGYRGEVRVLLINHDLAEPVTLQRGDRIAQLVVQRVETVAVVAVDDLDATDRGAGGFGSTGR